MKKKLLLLTLICITSLSSLTACGSSANTQKDSVTSDSSATAKESEKEDNSQIANPWTDCATLAEAEENVGFSLEVPEAIGGYPDKVIRTLEKEMIEVIYKNDDGSITIRKGNGSDDISGDYNTYSESQNISVGDYDVTARGNDEKVMLATWISGDYSYSVNATGMNIDTLTELIQQVK